MKKNIRCVCILFVIGGCLYGLVEILWRRYTHWSMVLTGGVCFTVLYKIFKKISDVRLMVKCVIGSSVITFFELIAGFIFNICLKLDVWDYSDMRFNFCGQICPLYSFLWGLLTIPVSALCNTVNKKYRL